jgi:dipeptidyl aminopeptidase/acylaminoacyl peptidase
MTLSRRAVLAGLGLAAGSPASAETVSPSGLRIGMDDYAADRTAFQTRLLVRGPSPQRRGMPVAPSGVRDIDYPSGNLRLRAWAGMPFPAPARAPVVIFVHGGFAFSASDYDMARPFLAAGYAVVTPIMRGENGQAGEFSMFYDELNDVLAATDHVRRQPWADPERIYIAGHSAGGTMAMLAGLASPHYRAIASFSGSPDQLAFWPENEPASRIVPFDTRNPAEYEMRSPLSYAASFKASARLFWGDQEFYGSPEPFFRPYTQRTARLAREAGKNVEAVELAGDHFTAVPEAVSRTIAFFAENA